MYQFGERLRMVRRQKGLSLEEVALAVGSTKSTLSKYERGIVDPSLEAAQGIADYFMVSIDWLSGRGDESEIKTIIPQIFIEVSKYAISKGMTADQIKEAVDFALKMRGDRRG